MAKLLFSADPAIVESLGRAGFWDYAMLAARIRDGSACQAERNFAADVLEGKRKRPANRPQSYDNFNRNFEIYNFVEAAMGHDRRGKKLAAIAAAKDHFNERFGLGESAIRDAHQEISDVIDKARADEPD